VADEMVDSSAEFEGEAREMGECGGRLQVVWGWRAGGVAEEVRAGGVHVGRIISEACVIY